MFFRRFSRRFLAGSSLPRMGKRLAFFVFGRCLMRRIVIPRGHPMLQFDSSSTLLYLSSGRPNVRRGSIGLYQGVALPQPLFHSIIRSAPSHSDFRSAKTIFNNHADMGGSTPVSALFVPRTRIPVDYFSAN